MNSETTTKKNEVVKLSDWAQINTLPLQLLHTVRGPVIGRVATGHGQGTLRVFAPAHLGPTADATEIAYVPIQFVESYIDLYTANLIGISDPPELLEAGYHLFQKEFALGSYKIKPIMINAGVEAETVVIDA